MGYEQIRGWMDFESIYDQAVAEAQPGDVLVEVGVAYGKSLAYLAEKMDAAGKTANKNIIIGIDPWIDGDWEARWDRDTSLIDNVDQKDYASRSRAAFEAEMMCYAPHARDRVAIWQRTSLEGAELYRQTLQKASMVFIDADHTRASVIEDIRAWMPLIRKGGFIAGHDHTGSFPGVEEGVREMFGGDYEVRGSSWFKRL